MGTAGARTRGTAQPGGEHAPPGWAYNPSDWSQRLPIVGLALVGSTIASYLALYQWGVLLTVWEPFFGDGSRTVPNSGLSRLLPIPDAALGALCYLTVAVTGGIGGRGRWRGMPWMVILFGLAVGPLGAVNFVRVIAQPILYGSFCTLCLASAVISVLMVGPALDELLASLQWVKRERDRGRSLWRALRGCGDEAGAGR